MGKREGIRFGPRSARRYMHLDGFKDEPALTVLSAEGSERGGREVSLGWLAGTVLTGVTSVLLMGAALYVSFAGVDSFSTAYKALDLAPSEAVVAAVAEGKTDRRRPVLTTRSSRDEIEASVLEDVGGTNLIRNTTFVRVNATLATSETILTDDVAAYEPQNYLGAVVDDVGSALTVSLDVMGEPVDAEVVVTSSALPPGFVPAQYIDDTAAASFAAVGISELAADYTLAYASVQGSVYDLAPSMGVAENVTVVPKNSVAGEGQRISERIVKLEETTYLADALLKHGFSAAGAESVIATVRNVVPVTTLAPRSRLRILLGPSRSGSGLIPYRLSIYRHDDSTNSDTHIATVALTDAGQYVLGLAPSDIPFAEDSTESISVANLPTIYKSIWETGRRNELDDATISRIIALVAYDVDLSRRVQPGDSLELLQAASVGATPAQLLYVSLRLGNSERNLYRFRTDDGAVAYFDESGESGKRFLLRRPLEGGGRLTSAMGSRVDPFNGGNANHEGTDFAAPRGTPIFAAADGTVEMAQWYSGYGRYVRLSHANGYSTAYAHMNQIADGIAPGNAVRQGQVIGYVGSTGRSTGNHLHFELEINGRIADPLEVKLPRARTLPPQYDGKLQQTIEQVRAIMDAAPRNQASSA
ncbi:M23 family metallopeptidase [Devosia naphthalenivorans]|uniref:M23 family metallopeptidase n=1 Tax=Devosia naphthalenivorans TaxID=2082392 RepID=UPI0013B056FF|nr:M23 family metallopeptidase [Devosia naphthalenivorans]